MRGAPRWICLTEGKSGALLLGGGCGGSVPLRGRCCGRGAGEMGREGGMPQHLAHLRVDG